MILGIDISAAVFDVVSFDGIKRSAARTFNNTDSGHKAFIKYAKKLKPAMIGMEATGVYHINLALALVDAGLSVSVINPLSIKSFAKAKLRNVKTDAADAALIAEFTHVMKPGPWNAPTKQHIALKDLTRRINRLTRDKAREKNRLHALTTKRSGEALIEDTTEAIAHIEQRLQRLINAAMAIIEEDPALSRALTNLASAKGVGQTSAMALLGEFVMMDKAMKAKQVSRFAGLDVTITRSGSSVRGVSRISKAGNMYLRCAMYMPAMCVSHTEAHAEAFKARLEGNGKTRKQAIAALMRKMLMGLWKVYVTEQLFDPTKLYHVDIKSEMIAN